MLFKLTKTDIDIDDAYPPSDSDHPSEGVPWVKVTFRPSGGR